MAWRKLVPLEVLPLGVFTGGAIIFAGYRLYILLNKPEVMLTKKRAETYQWKEGHGENESAAGL